MTITRHGRIGPLLRFLSVVVVSLTTGLFKRDWRHIERIPKDGPAIIAVNHVSYADPFVVARLVWDAGRIPRFLGKAPLFEVPVVGTILSAAGQIPVRRATRAAADSLDDAVAALRAGEIVVIYPEGTVTRDPDFWPIVGKTGVARLALLAPQVPLIPVGQWGFAELGRLVPPPVPAVAAQGRDRVGRSAARPLRLRGSPGLAHYAASLDRCGDDEGA